MTTKDHLLADPFGRRLRIRVTSRQVIDIAAASYLLEGQQTWAVFADKADADKNFRNGKAGMSATAVIPSKCNHTVAILHDAASYKHRNQIGPCSSRLKHFRRTATRYDRYTAHFTDYRHLAATTIWVR